MTKRLILFCLLSVAAFSQTLEWIPMGSGSALTTNVCETSTGSTITGSQGCPSGPYSYSGAAYDSVGGRLIFPAQGGHGDYGGNEGYALNVRGTPTMERIWNFDSPGCMTGLCAADAEVVAGTSHPNSRHTYGGLTTAPNLGTKGVLFMAGGGLAPGSPAYSDALWMLDMATVPAGGVSSPTWTALSRPGTFGSIFTNTAPATVYDSVTNSVFALATDTSYSYVYQYTLTGNPPTSTVRHRLGAMSDLAFHSGSWTIPMESVGLAPDRRMLFGAAVFGGVFSAEWYFINIASLNSSGSVNLSASDVAHFTSATMDATCAEATATYSGLAVHPSITYDPVWRVFAIYPEHGNAIYLMNPGDPFHVGTASDTTIYPPGITGGIAPRACAKIAAGSVKGTDYPIDAKAFGAPTEISAYGRFSYMPDQDAFIYSPYPGAQAWKARIQRFAGQGCTTAVDIDKDCDGYGIGPDMLGPDADDNDPQINTTASITAKYCGASKCYASVQAFLTSGTTQHVAYAPLKYRVISTDPSAGNCSSYSTLALALAATPCTWEYALFNSVAGDMVVVRGGTYTWTQSLEFHNSGTAADPIIVVAYPGEKPLIEMGSYTWANVNRSGWTVDGIFIHGGSTQALKAGTYYTGALDSSDVGVSLAHDITVRNVSIQDSATWGMNITDGLDTVLIEDNRVCGSGTEHGLYFGSRSNPSVNVTVRRNLLCSNGGNGMQFNGRVSNFTFTGNIAHSNMMSGLSLDNGANVVATNNVFFNNGRSGFTMEIYNPGLANCDATGTYGICPHNFSNETFQNNSIWIGSTDPSGVASMSQQPCMAINQRSDTPGAYSFGNITWKGNICVNQNGWLMDFGSYTGDNTVYYAETAMAAMTLTNNFYYAATRTGDSTVMRILSSPYGYHTLSYEPGWANNTKGNPSYLATNTTWWNAPENFDLDLSSSSTAIGAGGSVTPATDVRGLARLNPTSSGAYEVGGAAAAAPPIYLVSVTIQPTPASIAIAGTQTYTCVATWSDASTDSCPGATWASSMTSVATVSAGTATGVAAGTTSITATYQGVVSNGASLTVLGTPVVNKTKLKGHPICRNCTFK